MLRTKLLKLLTKFVTTKNVCCSSKYRKGTTTAAMVAVAMAMAMVKYPQQIQIQSTQLQPRQQKYLKSIKPQINPIKTKGKATIKQRTSRKRKRKGKRKTMFQRNNSPSHLRLIRPTLVFTNSRLVIESNILKKHTKCTQFYHYYPLLTMGYD